MNVKVKREVVFGESLTLTIDVSEYDLDMKCTEDRESYLYMLSSSLQIVNEELKTDRERGN